MSQQLGKEKKTQFAFNFLSLDDVEEGAKMVTIGFLTLNSIWKKLNIPFEEAYEFNKFRLIQGVKTNWSFSVSDAQTKKLLGVSVYYDLYDVLHTCSPPPKMYDWLKYIKRWGLQVENEAIDELGFRNVKKGQIMYVDFGGTDPKQGKAGLGFKLYAISILYFKECGFKGIIQRTTHEASQILFQRLGGKSHKRIVINDPEKPEMNGEYMDLGYMELKNFKLKSLEQIYGIRDEDDYIF